MATGTRSEIDEARYIALTTFTRDGRPKTTPVWVAGGGGRYVVVTSARSYKVKRLRRDPRVELAASDARGRPLPGARVHRGTARILEGPEVRDAVAAIRRKYGPVAGILPIMNRIRARGRAPGTVAIEITLEDPR
jgi:PPOX class probable F420-dependent enzyme